MGLVTYAVVTYFEELSRYLSNQNNVWTKCKTVILTLEMQLWRPRPRSNADLQHRIKYTEQTEQDKTQKGTRAHDQTVV
jgi:hypothetical protein